MDFLSEQFSLPWANAFILLSQKPLHYWTASTWVWAALHHCIAHARTRKNPGPEWLSASLRVLLSLGKLHSLCGIKHVWETKEVGKRNKSLSYWTSLGWEETARVSSVPGQYAAFSRFKGLKYGYKWKRQMKKDLEGVGGAGVQEYNLLYNSFCEGWHTYQCEGLWPGPIGGTMGWVGRHSPSQPKVADWSTAVLSLIVQHPKPKFKFHPALAPKLKCLWVRNQKWQLWDTTLWEERVERATSFSWILDPLLQKSSMPLHWCVPYCSSAALP